MEPTPSWEIVLPDRGLKVILFAAVIIAAFSIALLGQQRVTPSGS